MSGVEYRVVRAGGYNSAAAETAMTDVLNEAAADGWRVAAATGAGDTQTSLWFVLVRPAP
jgi:Domain of unknown function (DUF4177)